MHHIDLLHRRIWKAETPSSVNVNDVHAEYKQRLGMNGRIASVLTAVYGSMWFVYALVLGVASWMLLQSWLGKASFDPYPYVFCLFIGNIIQLLGGPIIQVGQNLSTVHSELRAESDHMINLDLQEHLTRMESDIKELRGLLVRIALEQEHNEKQEI